MHERPHETSSLSYPLTYNSMRFNGPTLVYLDATGTPVQLQLTNDQVQWIVDDWNAAPDDSAPDEVPVMLKPPLGVAVEVLS